MEEQLLREIAKGYLVPLFSGASIEDDSKPSTDRHELVALLDPISIAFKVDKEDNYRLVLTRPQPWAKAEAVTVPEIAVVRAFVEVIRMMAVQLASNLKHDLLSTFERRVVSQAIGSPTNKGAVLSGIDQLIRWAARLYEGSPIAAAIGFRHKPQPIAVALQEFGSADFSAVMSNGHDTILEFYFSRRFIGHQSLVSGALAPTFCPYRQAPIAQWTTHDERRVALTLNRLGEIMVFRDEMLLFTRRSAHWSFLTHEPIITQMGTPHDLVIRRAVYETCLDASFARTGACIGVVSSSLLPKFSDVVTPQDDLRHAESMKAKAIKRIIGGSKFHQLDRRLRQELSAIDGAIVISHEGQILAVGAILKIPGGSTGGGRLAAAKALSRLGLGVKVSQDGGITGFRLGSTEPAFRLM